MHTHTETRFFPYSTAQLFTLVADVERYPEFLPWCKGARILEREEGVFLAELIIRFKHISEKYTSKVVLNPPSDAAQAGSIEVILVRGPFKTLYNDWHFIPEKDGCKVEFGIGFEFQSRMLDLLIGGFFSRATEKMVGAFSDRAHALYGEP